MRRDDVPLTMSGDCKELREGTARAPCPASRSGRRTAHEEAVGKPRQQFVGRFPAWPVSIEHERQHADAGLAKKSPVQRRAFAERRLRRRDV